MKVELRLKRKGRYNTGPFQNQTVDNPPDFLWAVHIDTALIVLPLVAAENVRMQL